MNNSNCILEKLIMCFLSNIKLYMLYKSFVFANLKYCTMCICVCACETCKQNEYYCSSLSLLFMTSNTKKLDQIKLRFKLFAKG